MRTDKEAWQLYRDYCLEQTKKYAIDSHNYRYYSEEIAKCDQQLSEGN